ncbi:DUF3592 domain-containing protein [Streptomyces sp. 891-h]|uniref:DUF3592 domain-containing protein n=1 Tax=Streptomyces sp. 891-h TaxID=2720714 RepID=UPI001FAAB57A|nr:DUF3592 domain-containing protein [Streptomyces sp. 891-h]UNZ21311.1 DUF3592 domain-containing protein [Streptomyces sp. 891-h]
MSWKHVLGWFWAVMFGGFSLASFGVAWEKYCLNSRGRWIEGEIVRVDEDKDTDGAPRFYPVVAFTPPDGDRVEVKSPSGKPYPPGLASGVGCQVSVRYDPARPTRIELSGDEGVGVLSGLLLGVVLAGVAGFIASEMIV